MENMRTHVDRDKDLHEDKHIYLVSNKIIGP